MRLSRRNNLVLLLLLAAVTAIGFVLLATHTAASASSPEPGPVGYHKPVGVELSPTSAAEAAIKSAREGTTASGTIYLRVAEGRFAQAKAVLDENEGVYGPATSGQASCFPGMACNSIEVEEAERIQREEDESSAYIVEMTGAAFSPPRDRLKKGENASTSSGEIETIIVDAHTGLAEARTIGGQPRNLKALGKVTELTATIPSEASEPALVRRSRRVWGVIVGRVVGLSRPRLPIVLSEGDMHVSPRDEHVVGRTMTSSKGTFEMTEVVPGRYSIGVHRPNCRGKKIMVEAGKTTQVTLMCRS